MDKKAIHTGNEFERRFLLDYQLLDDFLSEPAPNNEPLKSVFISQTYVSIATYGIARVRLERETRFSESISRAVLCFKQEMEDGSNTEVEIEAVIDYAVALADSQYKVGRTIEKTRYYLPIEEIQHVLEIDVFRNEELRHICIAELETQVDFLKTCDVKCLCLPDFVLNEITGVKQYSNFSLANPLR